VCPATDKSAAAQKALFAYKKLTGGRKQ